MGYVWQLYKPLSTKELPSHWSEEATPELSEYGWIWFSRSLVPFISPLSEYFKLWLLSPGHTLNGGKKEQRENPNHFKIISDIPSWSSWQKTQEEERSRCYIPALREMAFTLIISLNPDILLWGVIYTPISQMKKTRQRKLKWIWGHTAWPMTDLI